MSIPVTSPLRLGILSTANIGRKLVNAVRDSSRVAVVGVASRNEQTAAAFAAEVGIARSYGTYDALLAAPDIDAIYVPLPNGLHAAWAIRAAQAGKHVLCEKPLAADGDEAEAMFAAARANGVTLVEAYPYRSQPQTATLASLLAQNAIGKVQTIHAAFGFPLALNGNIRWDEALAGGALMDAGSYPVSLARMIAGARPSRVTAQARYAHTKVDSALVATLEFANGILATIACSFSTARHRYATIIGDAGRIDTNYFNDTDATMPPIVQLRRGVALDAPVETLVSAQAQGFRAQCDAFADCVQHGLAHWTGATETESIDIAHTLAAMRNSARSGQAVSL